MTRFLFHAHKRVSGGLARLVAFSLIVSLALPLPVISEAATASHSVGGNDHVLRRLNSPERKVAIEQARSTEAAARATFTDSESSAPSDEKGEFSTTGVYSYGTRPELKTMPDEVSRRTERPKTMTEVLFNGVAGFMGMPGLQDGEPSGIYADPGLGDSSSAAYHAQQRGGMSGLEGMSDPQSYFMQRGLNYGVGQAIGWANSMGEAAFTGLFDKGRARFNFMVDMDGRINGEGDVLYPFYDGQYSTVFTQVGARSMSGMNGGDNDEGRGGDRWIGNFGLGQRWYPTATVNEDGKTVDSGNWMIGYNAFFDNDFTRSHQRGGFGVDVSGRVR